MKAIEVRHAVVVVTGASDDVGRAIAEGFAREGARLVLAGRDPYALKHLSADCNALGAETLIVEADITDTASARKLVNAARAFDDHIDVWISRAEGDRIGLTPDIDAVIPVFVKQKRGVLINVTSGEGLPGTWRTPLSARRAIHLCDLHIGSCRDAIRIARSVAELARAPRPRATLGANDNVLDRILKAGTAAGLAALAGVGGLVSALEAARIG